MRCQIVNKDFPKALITDIVGMLIYGGFLTMIINPPLGLSSMQLMGLGLVFPVSAYVVTYRLYPEQFWKAFFGSLVVGAVIFLGGFWLYANMVF